MSKLSNGILAPANLSDIPLSDLSNDELKPMVFSKMISFYSFEPDLKVC